MGGVGDGVGDGVGGGVGDGVGGGVGDGMGAVEWFTSPCWPQREFGNCFQSQHELWCCRDGSS